MLAIALLLVFAHLLFLPGALLLLIGNQYGWRQPVWPLALPISIGLNFVLMLSLVSAGVLSRPLLFALILLELGLVLALLIRTRRKNERRSPSPSRACATIWIALIALLLFAPSLWSALLHVFESGDAVLSWNRWALDWASGQWPGFTMTYPQLVPATWATIYTALGDPLEQFARVVGVLAAAAALLLIVDLGLRRRQAGPVISGVFMVALTYTLLHHWLDGGYADTMVVLFSAGALYPILALREEAKGLELRGAVFTSVLMAVFAAHTKQAGLWLLVAHPFLLFGFLHRHTAWTPRQQRFYLTLLLASATALVMPWYIYKQWQIITGAERDITAFILGRDGWWHTRLSLVERIPVGYGDLWATLLASLGHGGTLLLAAGLLSALRLPAWRLPLLGFALPYTLFWAAAFSYDSRNLALLIPVIAVAVGHGIASPLSVVLKRVTPHIASLAEKARAPLCLGARLAGGGAIVLSALAFGFIAVAPDWLQARQTQQMLERGYPEVNALVIDLLDAQVIDGPVLSNYRWLESTPRISDQIDRYYERLDYHRFSDPSRIFSNLESLELYLETVTHPPRQVLLIGNVVPYALPAGLVENVVVAANDGRFRLRARGTDWVLFEPAERRSGP